MELWIDKLVRECRYSVLDAVRVAVGFATKGDYEGLDQYVTLARANHERRQKNVSAL